MTHGDSNRAIDVPAHILQGLMVRDDLQRIGRKHPRQYRLDLIGHRVEPLQALELAAQDHGHRLRVNWLNKVVGFGG